MARRKPYYSGNLLSQASPESYEVKKNGKVGYKVKGLDARLKREGKKLADEDHFTVRTKAEVAKALKEAYRKNLKKKAKGRR